MSDLHETLERADRFGPRPRGPAPQVVTGKDGRTWYIMTKAQRELRRQAKERAAVGERRRRWARRIGWVLVVLALGAVLALVWPA